jgi:uncharacterized Zn finger protein (UPF0148 family)
MFQNKCPQCGIFGRLWNKEPEVFVCPNCSSLFSKFGFVLEAEKEYPDMWS